MDVYLTFVSYERRLNCVNKDYLCGCVIFRLLTGLFVCFDMIFGLRSRFLGSGYTMLVVGPSARSGCVVLYLYLMNK